MSKLEQVYINSTAPRSVMLGIKRRHQALGSISIMIRSIVGKGRRRSTFKQANKGKRGLHY
eukprot:scaffold4581_cov200-Skeletonema_menzelii.AAC.3